jgi:hypothetical protein
MQSLAYIRGLYLSAQGIGARSGMARFSPGHVVSRQPVAPAHADADEARLAERLTGNVSRLRVETRAVRRTVGRSACTRLAAPATRIPPSAPVVSG